MSVVSKISGAKVIQLAQAQPTSKKSPANSSAPKPVDSFQSAPVVPSIDVANEKTSSAETAKFFDEYFKLDGAVIKLTILTDGKESITTIRSDAYKKLSKHPLSIKGHLVSVEFSFNAPLKVFDEKKMAVRGGVAKVSVGSYATFPDRQPEQVDVTQSAAADKKNVSASVKFVFNADVFGKGKGQIAVPLDFKSLEKIGLISKPVDFNQTVSDFLEFKQN